MAAAAVAAQAQSISITSLQSSVVPSFSAVSPANITSIAGGTPITAFRLYINGTFAVGAVPTVHWVNPGPGNPANQSFTGILVNTSLVQVDIPASAGAAAPISIFGNPVASTETVQVSVTQGALTSNTANFFIVPQMSALALPNAGLGVPYSAPFVTGGTRFEDGSYYLSDTSGSFPPGITVDFSGSVAPFTNSRLVGTATASGLYTPTVFLGDFWDNSAALDLSIRVAATPTVTAPVSNPVSPFPYGTVSSLTTQVSGTPTPTGTVTFYEGAVPLGGAVALNGSGVGTLSGLLLATGTHNNITAVYSGDGTWTAASSAASSITVTRATPTLTVTGAPFSAVYGGTLSAGSFSIAGAGGTAAAPTGSVATSIGATTILTSNSPFAGSVPVTGTALPATVTANLIQIAFAYGGDTNYLPITTNAAIAIARANPTTAVAFNPNPVAVGVNEAITATTGTAIPGCPPTGNVTFLDGGNSISGAVALTAGAATFNINTLTAGAHNISFSYSGDTNFAPLTSGASTLNVTSGAPTVSAPLSSAGATFTYGTTTNLQSTVTPASPLPTGTIEFFDGTTSLGASDLVAGTATVSNVLLATGVHNNITAVYSGDSNWASATSPASSVTVTRATPTLTVTGAPFSAVYGGTLSAGSFSIAGAGGPAAAPTGSVVTSIGGITILTSNSPFAGSVPVTGTPCPLPSPPT